MENGKFKISQIFGFLHIKNRISTKVEYESILRIFNK